MRRVIIITVSILAAIFAAWCAFAPRVSWDGAVVGRIAVNVLDEGTLTPIADATVELRHPRRDEAPLSFSPDHYDELIASATTAASGTAQITALFGAGGSIGPLGRSGRAVYRDIWVQVSANGYEMMRTRLSRYTGDTRSVRRDQTSTFTIKLAASQDEP